MTDRARRRQEDCPEAESLSCCIAKFQMGEQTPPQQNLAEFVRTARYELTVYGADLNWDHWHWRGIGMFLKHGCPSRVGNPNGWHMKPEFSDFAKAYIRYEQGMNPTSCSIGKARLAALRAIEYALVHERGSAAPVDISLTTLDHAAQAIRVRFVPAAAYTYGRQLMHIARFLDRHGLTNNATGSWVSPLSYPSEIHTRLGAEADAHRRSKLPDMTALNAIGTLFARGFNLADNANHADAYVTSVVAMLMAQPGRIGEIHDLAIDLEIEQHALDGSLQYGFRYRSEKVHQSTRIKWVPAIWVPFAKEAVRRIREITERPRAFARYVEEQLELRKAGSTASLRFYRHPGCPNVTDDEPLTAAQAAAALGHQGNSHKQFLQRRSLTLGRGAHSLNSLWLHILDRMPDGFPYIKGAGNKCLKYSEALFCMHTSQLKRGASPNPLSLWMPSDATLAPLISPNMPLVETIFARHRMTGERGQQLCMNSHQFRHLLNTLGHQGTGDTYSGS